MSWRQELLASRDVSCGGGAAAFPCSRPNSFLSFESSDLGSEDGGLAGGLDSFPAGHLMEFVTDHAATVCIEAAETAPSGVGRSSTPVKDTTPTNEEAAAAEEESCNSVSSSLLLLAESEQQQEATGGNGLLISDYYQ